jgi:hypothetical protein
MRGAAGKVHASSADFDEEEHVQASEPVGCVNSISLQMTPFQGRSLLARARTLEEARWSLLTHDQACALPLGQSHSLTNLS